MSELNLHQTTHPNKNSERDYEALIGIDQQKESLMQNLVLALNPAKIDTWLKKHHKGQLPFLQKYSKTPPLFILSGEVGCGKTALASSIATPLGKTLNKRILVLETPSNIRGSGRVGEISNRITGAFEIAFSKVRQSKNPGILIIDEADDLATSRAQNQAHHEDRAGLNVLLKQIERIQKEGVPLAIFLITNRLEVIDPAIQRRAALILEFKRPEGDTLKKVFRTIFEGQTISPEIEDALFQYADQSEVPYSFSDLIIRAGKQTLLHAIEQDKQFSPELYLEKLKETRPSPLLNTPIKI